MRYFLTLLIILAGSFGFYYYQETVLCEKPISYSIDSFDVKFGISKDKFLATIKEAELIWESGTGQNLFNSEADGTLKINLVFDERQRATIEANRSKGDIEESRSYYDSLLIQYKLAETSYKAQLRKYETQVQAFEFSLRAYNEQVAQANKTGGAKPDEYRRLEEERAELEAMKDRLDKERQELNSTASDLNNLGNQVNELAQKLNITVDIHNTRFGEAREFDQGEYTHNKINVYQFEGISDLRLVLAHELGHALGIDHVENPKSIMYYLMDKQELNKPALSAEDKTAFGRRCEFEIPKIQELFNLSQLSQSLY